MNEAYWQQLAALNAAQDRVAQAQKAVSEAHKELSAAQKAYNKTLAEALRATEQPDGHQ
jgi:F0F1-type ATP synthase membrane subunit b/b'